MNITCLHRIIIVPLLSSFITTRELGVIDVALTNVKWREWYHNLLQDDFFDTEGVNRNCTTSYVKWLILRNLKIRIVTIKQLVSPRIDLQTVRIFDRLLVLNIHMNVINESILKRCCKTLKSLKLVGNCTSQLGLLQDLMQCTSLEQLDIGHFNFPSTEVSDLSLLPDHQLMLSSVSCTSANISEYTLQQLLVRSEGLVSLNLNGCTQVTDDSLATLCKSCPVLESLSLGKSAISDTGIVAVCETLKTIVHIDLNRCAALTSVAILAIEKAYRHQLVSLNISFCTLVDNNALTAVHENCRKLRTLNITGCKGLSNHRVLQVLSAAAANMHIQV